MALAFIATACGGAASAGSGPTLAISAPADGATVQQPFEIRVTSSEPLGDPTTGDDHVHFCVDGQSCDTEYQLAYGDTFQMTGLTPGTHTIEASLRHADHSSAGVTASITVTVAGAAGAPSSAPSPAATSGGTGYGY